MLTIVQKDDPILRKKALAIPVRNIKSLKIKELIDGMKKALLAQDDGVALAAPQVGASLCIFIVSRKVFELMHSSSKKDALPEKKVKDLVFINPEIIKLSKEKSDVEEGCLSVRHLYGKIKRSKKARIRAYDEKGVVFEIGGSGLLAQIFQHETDHLDGKLFTDKARSLRNLPPKVE